MKQRFSFSLQVFQRSLLSILLEPSLHLPSLHPSPVPLTNSPLPLLSTLTGPAHTTSRSRCHGNRQTR